MFLIFSLVIGLHHSQHLISYAPEVIQAIGNFFSQVGTYISTSPAWSDPCYITGTGC